MNWNRDRQGAGAIIGTRSLSVAISSELLVPKLFPEPVCQLPGEYGFVAAVLATPLDDLPKLVYADWLDEHSDPRGTFLRVWLAARNAGKSLPKPYKTLSKCWLSVMGFTLDDWLVKQGNPAWAEAVRATAEPCLVVRAIPLEDGETVPTGGSKMGGLPDLHPDDEWPLATYDDQDGQAAFIAQWNLTELAVSPCAAKLPNQGLLSFFIDLVPVWGESEDGSYELMFTRDVMEVDEREPENLHEESSLPACRVEFREWLSIPDYRSPVLQKVLSKPLIANYCGKHFKYPRAKGSHAILGHAQPIVRYPTLLGSRKTRSLLTQFGPDEVLRLAAADGGTWYFMIPDADLKKGEFGGVHMDFDTW